MKPEESRDQDMERATAALVRAAKRARKLAQQTGTAIVVRRDGKLIREIPAGSQTSSDRAESA
jgi:hypothetical protein